MTALRSPLPLVLTAITSIACTHMPGRWQKVSSDHFFVYTDQSPHDYENVLERLEDVHDGLSSSFFGDTTTPPLEVFLFGEGEFHDLVGDKWGGMFIGQHGKQGILAFYAGGDPASLDSIAAHELAHGFIAATFRSVPVWFNEGFSSYLETVVVEASGGRVWFGSLGSAASVNAAAGRMVPTAELFSMRPDDFHGEGMDSHYATGWAVVHYVMHGENKQLRRRFDAFGAAAAAAGNRPAAGALAWHQTFPDIPLTELDGRVRDHVNTTASKHRDSRLGFAFTRKPHSEPHVEPAPPAHIDEVRARLRGSPLVRSK
jgi:hypothetical protein